MHDSASAKEVSPWLQLTRWPRYLKGYPLACLAALAALPQDGSHPILDLLCSSLVHTRREIVFPGSLGVQRLRIEPNPLGNTVLLSAFGAASNESISPKLPHIAHLARIAFPERALLRSWLQFGSVLHFSNERGMWQRA